MRSIPRLAGCAFVLSLAAIASGQDAPDEVTLRRGTQHHVRRDRAVGLVAVEPAAAGKPARARVNVSAGAYSLVAVLAPGERLRVGGATLEVVSVEPPGTLRLRRGEAGGADEPLRAAPEVREGALTLEPLALYRLPQGRVIGLGNVRLDGEGGAPVVTLTVFPAGFDRDPARGYDLHVDAAAGATLEGAVGRVRVLRLEPAQADRPGAVVLELLPPA